MPKRKKAANKKYNPETHYLISKATVKFAGLFLICILVLISGTAYEQQRTHVFFSYTPNNVTWACPNTLPNGTTTFTILQDNHASAHYQTLKHDRKCAPVKEEQFILMPTHEQFATHKMEVQRIR